MNFEIVQKYIPLYIKAGKLTLTLGTLGILLAVLIGLLCSMIRYYKIPILDKIVAVYIEVSRNTPILIQLFFMYYGLPKIGLMVSSETCGIIGLAFLGGSYMSESFRSGLEAVDKSQVESGMSVGLTRIQLMRYVIFPQALAISIPSIGANVIFLLKETSLFSAVALADLMYIAKDLIGLYYDTNEALFLLVISYLVILLPLSIIVTIVERKLRYAGYGV
ncbi:MAG: amino acid ABC transporter permease [Clostridioides sp.]|jgi:polar amino acid transport system permease protein|nr:amino acid ABC transporter permease [Clostridioides sp.]